MISLIMPCEEHRLPLMYKSLDEYIKYGLDDVKVLVPTRTVRTIKEPYDKYITLIPYEYIGKHFNPAMALNVGVHQATTDYVIITSPEVRPITNVIEQLKTEFGNNVICQVYDCKEDGTHDMSLVNSKFRSKTPGYYFLAMYNKTDVQKINGWDEDFCNGVAYEDDNFGDRWVKAGIPFKFRDDIQAEHQWHERVTVDTNYVRNGKLFDTKKMEGRTKCLNGINKLIV